MTTLCSSGTSQIKPGVAGNNVISGGLISEGLLSVAPELLPFALFVDAFLYDATSQCTNDPPAMPTFDATDVTNCIGGVLNPNCQTTLNKIKTALLNWFWYRFCECSGGSITPPFVPAAPIPNTNTGTQQAPQAAPCFSAQYSALVPSQGTSDVGVPRIDYGIGVGNGGIDTDVGGRNTDAILPTGAVSVTWRIHVNNEGSNPLPIRMGAEAFDSGHGIIASYGEPALIGGPYAVGSDTTVTYTLPSLSTMATFELFPLWQGASFPTEGTNSVDLVVSLNCSGSTSALVPCPPDPAIMAALQQIIQLLQSVYSGLPLPITSFAESTVHSGLTGSGNFATGAGTIGAKVAFVPATSLGEAAGDPLTVFDAGWITTAAVEGNYKSRRIEHNPELIMFDPLVDAIHYTLSAGVTATITEITRGP